MIISASRRTDIPAWYGQWFLERLAAQFVLVPNPHNPRQISRVSLSPQVVDCIVFWTKNPISFIDKLDFLAPYPFYFQFTLNAYGPEVEEFLPSLSRRVTAFQELSQKLGPERVLWRYDPIFISPSYTVDFHLRQFELLAKALRGYTRTCTFSFLDFYKKIAANIRPLHIEPWTEESMRRLAKNFAEIARDCGITLQTCGENIELGQYGIQHARCIDPALISRLLGCELKTEKDSGQRPACGCAASIDIGVYNTCRNGCLYCYANEKRETVLKNFSRYCPHSPILCGEEADGVVAQRPIKSLKEEQLSFFS